MGNREKRMKHWGRVKGYNISAIGVPEREEIANETEEIFKEIISR